MTKQPSTYSYAVMTEDGQALFDELNTLRLRGFSDADDDPRCRKLKLDLMMIGLRNAYASMNRRRVG